MNDQHAEAHWLRRLLADLRDPYEPLERIAAKHGLPPAQVRQIVLDNRIPRHRGPGLHGGRWVAVHGVQRWVPDGQVVA